MRLLGEIVGTVEVNVAYMGYIPRIKTTAQFKVEEKARELSEKKEKLSEKKEDVMRLVEAQIAGSVDLSPEEMVDAAFLIVERIDGRLNGKV